MKLKLLYSASLLVLGIFCCEKETDYFRSFPPCDVCTAVKMINKNTKNTFYFDAQNTLTLRSLRNASSDSLTIRQNGVIIVNLPNFKQRKELDNKKQRTYYFESNSDQGLKTMRFTLTGDAQTPLIGSLLIDGAYNAKADSIDIYYKQK